MNILNYDKPWYPLASQTEQIMSIRMIHAHVCPCNLKKCQRANCLITIMSDVGEVLDPMEETGIQHFTFTSWSGLRSYSWLWNWHCLWLWHRWWHLLRCLLRCSRRWEARSCLLWNTCNKKSATRSKVYGPWEFIPCCLLKDVAPFTQWTWQTNLPTTHVVEGQAYRPTCPASIHSTKKSLKWHSWVQAILIFSVI